MGIDERESVERRSMGIKRREIKKSVNRGA